MPFTGAVLPNVLVSSPITGFYLKLFNRGKARVNGARPGSDRKPEKIAIINLSPGCPTLKKVVIGSGTKLALPQVLAIPVGIVTAIIFKVGKVKLPDARGIVHGLYCAYPGVPVPVGAVTAYNAMVGIKPQVTGQGTVVGHQGHAGMGIAGCAVLCINGLTQRVP